MTSTRYPDSTTELAISGSDRRGTAGNQLNQRPLSALAFLGRVQNRVVVLLLLTNLRQQAAETLSAPFRPGRQQITNRPRDTPVPVFK